MQLLISKKHLRYAKIIGVLTTSFVFTTVWGEESREDPSTTPDAAQSLTADERLQILPEMTVTAKEEQPYQVESSTAGTRFPAEMRRIPQSIQVINKDLITDKGILDLPRLLRNVPSANVGASRTFANGVFGNTIKIRGFDIGVTRNGFRHLYFEDVDPSAFSNIERVEILKGPGSAVFGQEGLGGTLNYVTKRPLDHFRGWFRGAYGENELKIGTWDFTGPLPVLEGELFGRFTGEIERSDTFVDFQEIDRDNLAASLAWDNGGPLRAFLNAEYQERDSFVHPGLPIFGTVVSNGIAPVRREAYLGEPQFEHLDYDGWIMQAWIDYDLNENWTLSPRFQYFEWNGLQDGRRLRGPIAGEPLSIVRRTGRFDFHEHDNEYSGQLQLTGQFATGPVNHQSLVGLEYSVYDDIGWWWNYEDVPNIDSLNPSYPLRAAEIGDTRLMFTTEIKTFAFYFQDLVSVTPDFDILGSVRYENIDILSNFCFGPCPNDVRQNTGVVTYQIGGAYRIMDPISLFAGYGTGIDVDSVIGGFATDGSGFEPEESKQIEAGIKIDSDIGLTGTLAYFRNTHSNIATPDPSDPNFRLQTGEQRAQGAELELAWQINDNLYLQGGYAYIDGEITKDNNFPVGNRLVDVAEHSANFWGRYQFTGGSVDGLSLAAGINYVGDRAGNLNGFTLGPDGEQVPFELSSYVTMDLSAGYQWNKLKFEVVAENVLDKAYFSAGNDFTVRPGQARQVFGRVGFQF